MTKPSLCLILAACAASSSHVARGEEESARFVTFEELAAAPIAPGQTIRTSGTYVELRDNEVQLFACPVTFLASTAPIRRAVLATSAEHQNLTFEAVRLPGPVEPPVFEVTRVSPAPGTSELLSREIEHLRAASSGNAAFLFQLARRIRQLSTHLEDRTLGALVQQALSEAIRIETERLDPRDAGARVALVEKAHEISGDAAYAVALLAALDEQFPGSPPVRKLLASLGSRKFRGRWMTYEAFKELQGFERHGSVWVTPREKDFLQTVFELQHGRTELIPRRRTDAEYRILAEEGQVATGMTPQEVEQALGYPERVYRRAIAGMRYDQWVYRDRYCYFEEGTLIDLTPRE